MGNLRQIVGLFSAKKFLEMSMLACNVGMSYTFPNYFERKSTNKSRNWIVVTDSLLRSIALGASSPQKNGKNTWVWGLWGRTFVFPLSCLRTSSHTLKGVQKALTHPDECSECGYRLPRTCSLRKDMVRVSWTSWSRLWSTVHLWYGRTCASPCRLCSWTWSYRILVDCSIARDIIFHPEKNLKYNLCEKWWKETHSQWFVKVSMSTKKKIIQRKIE